MANRQWFGIHRLGRTAIGAVLALGAAFATAGEDPAARGEYLVEAVAACGHCHTPRDAQGGLDMSRNLAGAFMVDAPPFTAYAPNITPDAETGIGTWSDDEIGRAIREGVRRDGTIMGPPMAYPFYRHVSDSDVRAIVAYLRTVPPVRNEVPRSEYRIPLPDSWGPPVADVADVPRDDPVAYGEYLAVPLGHCLDCHTPMVDGRHDMAQAGRGGTVFMEPFGLPWTAVAPNITPHPELGIGRWSDDELKRAIAGGQRPDGAAVRPIMPVPHYARMTDDDLNAIIAYLRTLSPLPEE